MLEIRTIQGGVASDERGQIRFVNEFDMSLVKRFYIIKNNDTTLIRGWRGHRIEQRWFYVLSGGFKINLIKIDDWKSPNRELPVESIELNTDGMELLHIPSGYATAFKALTTNSELLVYADHPLSHAILDDFTWPFEYFKNLT